MFPKSNNPEKIVISDGIQINKIFGKNPRGYLKVNIIDAKTKKVKEVRNLGENLVVNNVKLVMTHLLAQAPSQEGGTLQNIKAYDPRIPAADGGGIEGGVPIDGSSFNPTPDQLKLTYMAFGTNKIDATDGPNPDVAQYGLYNAVSKNGYTVESQQDFTVANFFYGGETTVYQYLRSQASAPEDEVSDGIIRIVVRMTTTEGQPAGGQIEYKEAGLFTTLFYPHVATNGGEQNVPLMFARKTFSTITKTESLELEFVWEIRF